MGRRHGAADARDTWCPAAPTRRDRRRQAGRLRGVLPYREGGLDVRPSGLRRPLLARSRREVVVGSRIDPTLRRWSGERRRDPRRRGAKALAEAAPAIIPAFRLFRG